MALFYESDSDVFLSDFAEDVVYAIPPAQGTTIKGIFSNGFREVNGVESFGPQVEVKSSDVVNVIHNNTITREGTTYKITGIQPDETGLFTILILSKD